MKILVIQDFLRSGGTERQSLRLAGAFAAAGHRTQLLTFRPGGALDRDPSIPATAPFARQSLQPFDLGLDWFAPGLMAAAARLAPDIVLCMGRMANCYGAGLQAALPIAAVISTCRTGKSLPWMFRRSLRRARYAVANSREARDTLVATYGLPADRVSVICNSLLFPAPSSLPERDQALRAQLGASPGTAVLLCVAMFRPEKNQRELIEIAAGLPPGLDWQLWLAGDGPARLACESFVRQHALQNRVKFLGLRSDPRPLYSAADVAVHASWSESQSNFLIEAQAHGLPAVAYQAQGVRECFLPGQTGWEIPRGDRAGFHAALDRLLHDSPPSRASRAAQAAEFARANFDPAQQVNAYLSLFQGLLSLAHPGNRV
jgi:glycosyltransferase involved in cell wall biosynthesis